jgi:hypothetical protein
MIQWKKFQIHYTVNWATDAIQLIDIKPDPSPTPKKIFAIGKLAQRVAGVAALIHAIVKIVRRWMDLSMDPSAFMQVALANRHPGLRAAQETAHSTMYVLQDLNEQRMEKNGKLSYERNREPEEKREPKKEWENDLLKLGSSCATTSWVKCAAKWDFVSSSRHNDLSRLLDILFNQLRKPLALIQPIITDCSVRSRQRRCITMLFKSVVKYVSLPSNETFGYLH